MPLTADQINSPQKFVVACQQVKDSILSLITQQLVPTDPTTGEKIPLIRNRQLVDTNDEAWAGLLRSPRHLKGNPPNATEAVHTIQVAFGGFDTYDGRTVGRKGFRLRFTITSYLENEVGTDADNPDILLQAEVATFSYALHDALKWYNPGLIKGVEDYRERRAPKKLDIAIVVQSLAEFYVKLLPIPVRGIPLD